MPEFAPDLLARWTGGRWTAQPAVAPAGFATDSRRLQPGQVFVALRTDRRDGHDFLAVAQAAGATAALVARADPAVTLPQLVVPDPLVALHAIAREHRGGFSGPVIGITGSAGKTSTKNLLALLLGGEDGGVLATEGNLNNHLGVPLTLTRLDPARHRFAVIEAGISAPGEMAPLAAMIQPDLALITLVAPAHLAALGTVEGVAAEKSVLATAVRPGGVAVFPKDCVRFAAFRDLLVSQLVLERSTVLRPATLPSHTVHFNVIQRPDETVIVIAHGPPPPLVFKLRRVTDGMAQNAALALAAASRLGVPRELLQARLAAWTPAPLRGEIRREDGRLLYLDCYNASPASMADALATFVAITPPETPRLYVLGGMEELGAEAAAHHRRLGRGLWLRPGDAVWAVGPEAGAVREGALEAGADPAQVRVAAEAAAIRPVLAGFRGAIFVKGSRSHRLETLLAAEPAAVAAH